MATKKTFMAKLCVQYTLRILLIISIFFTCFATLRLTLEHDKVCNINCNEEYCNTFDELDVTSHPMEYGYDKADLRILILTYNRPKSLLKTLYSLQHLIMDGDKVSVHVWIDRSKFGTIDENTLLCARSFYFDQGDIFIHVHNRHVGVYGQWLKTWVPSSNKNVKEPITLYLEDDIDLSPYSYRWLRAAYNNYFNKSQISLFCLQDENAVISTGPDIFKEIARPKDAPVFLYQLPGSWGCAPHPWIWRDFLVWYEHYSGIIGFQPYTKDAELHTGWYKQFQEQDREDTMWTMWFIYYSVVHGKYCMYSNLPKLTGSSTVSLAYNRKEIGMHYLNQPKVLNTATAKLMQQWKEEYIQFPNILSVYNLSGILIDRL